MNHRFAATTLILLSTGLAGCGGLNTFVGGTAGLNPPLVTIDPNATATATAFVPLSPTETPIPTVTPTPGPTATMTPVNPWGNFAGPTEPSAIEIPPPMPEIRFKDGVVNIALLGSDARPNEGGWRTDTILILSLDRNAGTATLLSIPRDLYVYIPGWRVERINTSDVAVDSSSIARYSSTTSEFASITTRESTSAGSSRRSTRSAALTCR